MKVQKKNNWYCVGGRHRSGQRNIVGDMISKGSKKYLGIVQFVIENNQWR